MGAHTQASSFDTRRGIAMLWAGWWLAGAAWALQLAVNYALVEWYCRNLRMLSRHTVSWLLHGTSALALLMAASGVAVAWRNMRLAGWRERDSGGSAGRTRFLAYAGLLISCFFCTVIVVQWLPAAVLEVCP